MSRKFKETKIGGFLSKAAPDVLDVVGDFLPDSGVLGIAKKAIDKIVPNEAERERIKAQIDLMESEYLKDVQDARDLQKAALNQSDLFSKRFLYYFAIAMFAFTSTIVLMLFFVEIPEANQRIVDMILGVIVGTGLVSVINFFFGSSKSSHDKNDLMRWK